MFVEQKSIEGEYTSQERRDLAQNDKRILGRVIQCDGSRATLAASSSAIVACGSRSGGRRANTRRISTSESGRASPRARDPNIDACTSSAGTRRSTTSTNARAARSSRAVSASARILAVRFAPRTSLLHRSSIPSVEARRGNSPRHMRTGSRSPPHILDVAPPPLRSGRRSGRGLRPLPSRMPLRWAPRTSSSQPSRASQASARRSSLRA